MGMTSGSGHSSEECLRWARRVLLLGRGRGGALVRFRVFLAGSQSSSTSMGSSFITIVSIIEAHNQEPPYLQNGRRALFHLSDKKSRARAFVQQMSEIDKRRARFRVQIQRQHREEYFRSRRVMLMRGEGEAEQASRLMHIARVTYVHDAILVPLRQEGLMEELANAARSRDTDQCRLLMVICGNALMDNLTLEQRQAFAGLLVRLYKEHGIMKGDAVTEIATGLIAFASALSSVHEDIAAEGMEALCEMITALVQWALHEPSSSEMEQVAMAVIGSLWRVHQEFECDYQFEGHFRENVLFYNALLQLHPQLLQRHTAQSLVFREGLLQIFELITREMTLNLFPLVFEGQAFANFVLEEIVAHPANKQELALRIMINALVDYEKVDCATLMRCLTSPLPRKQAFFRRLLCDGPGSNYRIKMLNILLSQRKFYVYFQECFSEHWRQVVDLCVEGVRGDDQELIRFGLQTLMMMHQLREECFARHLLNQGVEKLLEDLLWRIGDARYRGREVEGEVLVIEHNIEYLLQRIRLDDGS